MPPSPVSSRGGAWFAIAAYTLWGLLPLYWRALHALPLGEVLAHRVLWSAATTLLLLAVLRRLPDLFLLAKDARKLRTLLLSALLIGTNWSIYILAVYRGELVQASLGYYINPLMSVAMGVLLLRERLSRLQILAVGLAAIGVLSLGLRQSGPPWVALGLALSFACYGYVKKRLPVDSMLGLSAETLWLTPVAAAYLAWHAHSGATPAFGAGAGTTALLVGAGAITLAPLFFFNAAARRLPLSTLGFYQYLSPTIQLAMAVLAFGEAFTRMHAIAFGLIWAALAIYMCDSFLKVRRMKAAILVVLCAGMTCLPAAADTPVDDFEAAGAPLPWAFSNGSEFPGAKGSLGVTQGPDGAGHAARLEGDFSGGGNYVSAGLVLPKPVSAPLLAFRARASAGSRIVVRVLDSSGQTLQYSLPRPLSAMDQDSWFYSTVDLGSPSLAYGGAADKVAHPPFKRIDFLLEVLKFRDEASPFNPHRLDFDDVAFLAGRGESLDPGAAPTPFAGTPSLDNLGVNIHFNRDDAALDALMGAGFAWLRMDLGWAGIEKAKGAYDFSAQDALVAAAAARGLKVHFILDFANPLYGSGPPVSAEAVAAFQAFSQATATHFRGKTEHFEVWNEPDLPGFWDPVDAQAYAAACAAAIAGVHAGNPAARVSTAGVSEVDWPFVRKALAAGGGIGADAIGVHPYRNGAPEGG